MGDRLRFRRRPPANGQEPMTAAARILRPVREDEPQPESWHPHAWHHRDNSGEVRYAELWLGNSMGRARLVAARRAQPGAEPEPLPESHPASQLMAALAGGVGGQSALLRSFGVYLLTPGVGYLVGEDPRAISGRSGGMTWSARSADQVRLSPTGRRADGYPTWEVREGDQVEDWRDLGPMGHAVKVWRPDPREYWKPDSPVRGALDILDELELLTASIKATATSRLAGAGLLPLPREMEFPGGWDKFVDEYIRAVTRPIKDRASAAATVPFPFQVPMDALGKIGRVDFYSAFDQHALALRAELIQRLGTAMDMPVRTLTGEQENHWGKAATADEGLKFHTVPNLELLCDALTRGYLVPGLVAGEADRQGLDVPSDGRELVEATQGLVATDDGGLGDIIAWYDLSDFTARPDKGQDAQAAYDRWEAGGDTLRTELGISEAKPIEQEELRRRVLLKVVDNGGDAALVGMALVELGIVTEDKLPALEGADEGEDEGEELEEPEEPAALPEPVPQTGPDDNPPSQERPSSPAQEVRVAAQSHVPSVNTLAVTAACDMLVYRALERCGNRLRTVTRRQRELDPRLDQDALSMHTICNATALRPPQVLFEGAWDRVPVVAAQLRLDPEALAKELDSFTLELVRTRTPYSWELLCAYLEPRIPGLAAVTPAERILATLGPPTALPPAQG